MTDRATLTDSPVSPADAAALIRGRRTIDRFKPGQVPEAALIYEAIELARWAPNHHRTEPWRFYLIGERTKAGIIELNSRLLAASRGPDVAEAKRERWQSMPGWLAVNCCPSDDPITAREDYAACACAVENLMLYLHSAGVGTKWASGAVTREPEFLELLGAQSGEYCVGLIWYGYAQRRPRSQRQSVDQIVRALD
ncbi:nitroreductase [Salinisphaera sp. LB1]|uniref:nitroreductase family protein n=1 Tax=Salinisphaera sp. LB1 TaxID=2183911 RepID=UPI000D7063F5|nr:nitroreductase [Salinisphaera sp. LB1]AWN16591.1 Nitroreductase [Salinisphaera sp. LB1]